MTSLTSGLVWIKASELIKEKFGKSLLYRSMKLISENAKTVNSEHFYSSGEDLVIPLKLKNFDLGDVIVEQGSVLDQQQKTELIDLVKFLVEPQVYNLQLKQTEDNLKNSQTKTLSLVNSKSVVSLYRSEKYKKLTLSQIILLKSHTELTRNKVALKIHEMTERNLFVHIGDIVASLTSVEDLRTLTDSTIYVNDIEMLTKPVLCLLEQYFKMGIPDGPLFLMGSSLGIEAIERLAFSENLKKDLMGFYFDIDRVPLSQQISEEILELLFFRLDSVLS